MDGAGKACEHMYDVQAMCALVSSTKQVLVVGEHFRRIEENEGT